MTTQTTQQPATQESFFDQVWSDIKTEAEKVWTEVKTDAIQIEQTGYADFKQVLTVGKPIAVKAVAAQVPLVLSGAEKFSAAVTDVEQELEKALGPTAIEDVRALVQLAYNGIVSIAGGAPGPKS